jgi:hypothetical protein
MIRRRLFFIFRFLAFAILVAVLVLWYRSWHGADSVRWGSLDVAGNSTTWSRVLASQGVVEVVRDRLVLSGAGKILPERVAGALPRGTKMDWTHRESHDAFMSPRSSTIWERMGFSFYTVHDSDQSGGAASVVSVVNDRFFLHFPFWAIAVLLVVVLLSVARRPILEWQRRRRGCCGNCGYDIRASGQRCSECGEPIVTPVTKAFWRSGRLAMVLAVMAILGGGVWLARETAERRVPEGDATWLDLGGISYQESEVDDSAAGVLKFGKDPMWFLNEGTDASQLEADVLFARSFEEDAQLLKISGQSGLTKMLPVAPHSPVVPEQLPLEDRAVRLSLKLSPGTTPAILEMELNLSSAHRTLYREVEHRNTNVLPFLFSLKVDGKPLRIPDAGMSKEGGRDYLVQLVEPGGTRTWKLRVNEKSLRELLPDSSPHTIEMFAAFSERQHEGCAGFANMLFENPWLRTEPGPQFIVRSAGAKLRWTGREWVEVK